LSSPVREAAGLSDEEFIMAFVRVEQRNAHLASAVRLVSVQGRDGQPVSKATLTAISNTRKGSGRSGDLGRDEEATAIQWTLWGKQADNAAQYLGKGSHVNVVGRVQNNNYEREGETVYTMAFTAEEIDYLDTKAEGEALRGKQGPAPEEADAAPASKPAAQGKGAKGRKPAAAQTALDEHGDPIPF
jgi:single-strand DNA-binding protein